MINLNENSNFNSILFFFVQIIYHHLLPDDVMARLKQLSISYVAYKTFAAFVDAGFDTSEYYLYLEDCFNAIYKVSS